MKRINKWYVIAIITWIVLSIAVLCLDAERHILKSLDTGLTLGVISVTISILSLGLASMSKPKFKGELTCWNVKTKLQQVSNSNTNPMGQYSCITFQINNKGKKPIRDLTVNFRFPSKVFYNPHTVDKFVSYFQFKETIIITAEHLRFLGSSSGDCELVLEHLLNLSAWDENRKFYITISGENIEPTTYKLDSSMNDSLLNSDSKDPIKPLKV